MRKRNNRHYMMLTHISQNPWTKEPRKLFDILSANEHTTMTAISSDINKSTEILDKTGVQSLKTKLMKSRRSKIRVK